jgi:hypothetical protein
MADWATHEEKHEMSCCAAHLSLITINGLQESFMKEVMMLFETLLSVKNNMYN